MVLNRSRNGWLGIDVGARLVKAAQLQRTRTGLEVVAAAIPRVSEALQSPLQQRLSEIRALRSLAPGMRGSDGAAVLSMRDCVLEAVADGAEQGNEKETTADEWGTGANAYRLSTSLGEVEAICDGLDRSGLRCHTIDATPTALARALQLIPGAKPDEMVVGFDWGAASATLVAAQAGEARYARLLRCPGLDDVAQQVGKRLSLSPQDAERALRRHGFNTEHPAGAVVAEALSATMAAVHQELSRTLSHMGSKLKTRPPSRWVLFGLAGAIPRMPEMLADGLDAQVEPWEPEGVAGSEHVNAPMCLFGPAIALSALCWEATR